MIHRNRQVVVLVGFCVLLGLWCSCPTGESTARLTSQASHVSRQRAETTAEAPPSPPLDVRSGDRILVDHTGRGLLEFPDLVMVEIYCDSDLRVRATPKTNDPLVDLYLTVGAIFCDTTPQERANRRIVVGTGYAQIEAIGTSFIVQYDGETRITWVVVLQGQVLVSGQGQAVLATTGQIVRVEPGQPPTWPETDAARAAQWLADLRADRSPTTSVAGGIKATITYDSYDAASGHVVFRVENAADGAAIECLEATVRDLTNNAIYYGPAHSNAPFRPDPLSGALQDSLSPGATMYAALKLTGDPVGVPPCRATFTLYTADNRGGDSVTRTVDLDLPASIDVDVYYYSYDASSGYVTFVIRNNSGATLECVQVRIIDRKTNASYYGGSTGAYSNTPFRPSPKSSAVEGSLPAGVKRYLRYKLDGNPAGVSCRATFVIYTADNRSGVSVTRTVDLTLPPKPTPSPSPGLF